MVDAEGISKRVLDVENDSIEQIDSVKKQKIETSDKTLQENLNKEDLIIDTKDGVTEADVGITEFLCHQESNVRIRGILKQRYTDFLVNEIDLNGNVVHLTDTGFKVKELTDEEKKIIEEQERKAREREENCIVDENDRNKLVEYFGDSDTNEILSLMNDGKKTIEINKVFNDKEERTQIHKLIREISNNKIESVTTSNNTFIFGHNANKSRRRKNTKVQAKIQHDLGDRKDYLHFSLYKENKETMEVASILAKFLKTQIKNIKYAGTKDRRGVTVQRMSIERFTVERVTTLNKALKGCKLGSFEYKDKPIKLGDLKGNEFIITIKDVESVDPKVSIEDALIPILNSLKNIGFINYFGMQRFGTFSISTHEIGKEILKSNWKTAAELILSEQKIVIPGSIEARKIWNETKDPSQAIKKMPRKCNAEYSILSRLERSEKDSNGEFNDGAYFNAIMGIPRNLRIMYGHAYQSYIWNIAASKRIQLFGLNVVAGDLVLCNNEKIIDEYKEELEKKFIDDDNDENIIQDFKETRGLKARPITQEEIDSKKFSIYDVVLPTPGYDVIYPENEALKNVYIETMAKDELNPFTMTRKVREFSLAGSYRQLISKIDNLEYYFRKYDNITDQLVRTDLEILKLKEEADDKNTEIKQILDGIPDGTNTAVILKLQLGVSTYATMALREILEGDTSRFGGVVNLKHD
jgi:tRNA pseudouridine13 synthase